MYSRLGGVAIFVQKSQLGKHPISDNHEKTRKKRNRYKKLWKR